MFFSSNTSISQSRRTDYKKDKFAARKTNHKMGYSEVDIKVSCLYTKMNQVVYGSKHRKMKPIRFS